MIFSHEITLDITLNEIKIINIKQYTKDSFVLHVNLTDRGEPFHADKNSLKCIFKMETPNQKYIYIDGDINEDGSVDISIPENACLTAGSGTAEVIFMDSRDDAIFATMNVSVNIVASAYNNSHITSSDDFDALHSALLAANKTYDYVMASANTSANAAKKSEDSAAASERNAAASALLSQSYAVGDTGLDGRENENEDCAKNYCKMANDAKKDSAASALLAQSYAVGGTNLDGRENENEDCAKKYCENAGKAKEAAAASAQLAQSLAESFSGALRPMGTVPFAKLPPIANASEGDMYNISDQFTTDNRFREGAGLTIPLGTNVYKTADNKWDILAGSPVTGVKGNAEDGYRKGNVNITPTNIGLGNVDNTADKNKSVKYAESSGSAATATKATQDGDGNVIKDSYAKRRNIYGYTFDGFTDPGIYMVRRAEGMGNPPLNISSAWSLIVAGNREISVSDPRIIHQIAMPDQSNDIYVRCLSGDVWSPWKKLLDTSGGTISGSLTVSGTTTLEGGIRIKPSGKAYGSVINIGDGDFVHISEPTDDNLEIKAKNVNFVTTGGLTLNNKKILTIDEIYPVGSIYMSVNSTNPSTLFGGTWAAWGTGKMPVGIDTSQTEFGTVEKTGGAKTHTLTVSELPVHNHSIASRTVTSTTNGEHVHGGKVVKDAASGTSKNRYNNNSETIFNNFTTSAGAHNHNVQIPAHSTDNKGNGTAHNNLPPYITCYMWKRTA